MEVCNVADCKGLSGSVLLQVEHARAGNGDERPRQQDGEGLGLMEIE